MHAPMGRTLVLLLALGTIAAAILLWPRDGVRDAGRREAAEAQAVRPVPAPGTAEAEGDTSDGTPPDTRLPLRLLATVVRENPALSIATLERKGGGAVQVLSQGDPVAGESDVRVRRIERARILLDHDGVREQLRIDWSDRAPVASAPVPATPRAPAPAAPPPSGDRVAAGGPLADDGELHGVYEDGEWAGVELGPVRPGGLYDRFGLGEGDVLTAVNGIPLDGPDAVVELLREMVVADQLELAVERADGSFDVLAVPTEVLDEALRQRE